MNYNSVEVKKLIEFAYYLHEKDMENYCKYDNKQRDDGVEFVPMVEDGFIGHPTKKLDNGTVRGYVFKEYCHSTVIPAIILDIVIGQYINQGFIYDFAMRIHLNGSLSNEDISERNLHFLMLKPDFSDCTQKDFPIIRGEKKKNSIFHYTSNIPKLVIDGGYGDLFDDDNVFNNMDEEEKASKFIKIMETLGFRKDDVIALLNGKMSAEEVFMEVAPPELSNKRFLYWNQRKYTFFDNVLVKITPLDVETSADIGISLDDLPFPFSGSAIIDASLVNTYGIDFGENVRGHKLVNINSNPKSICQAKLKNAVIDEIIDLSKVDATDTEFGHQVIINVDRAIGNLWHTDFLYAVDEAGNRFNIDEYGRLNIDKSGCHISLTIEKRNIMESNIKVLADASSYDASLEGFNNGADGIGLIRMEDMLTISGIPIYKSIFITDDEEKRKEVIRKCGKILREEAEKILSVAQGRRVVFRLLDAKLSECLTKEQICKYFNADGELRGELALFKYPEFLETQIRSILEAASKVNIAVDVLVPINYSTVCVKEIKKVFRKVAEEIDYHDYRVGAMIEYVWFANRADDIVSYDADFIAFGLNDLTENVTKFSRSSRNQCFAILDERVKEILKESIYRARLVNPSICIGLCGLHTNFAENIEFFLQIQIDYITCNPQFIPTAKRLLCNDDISKEQQSRLSLLPISSNSKLD